MGSTKGVALSKSVEFYRRCDKNILALVDLLTDTVLIIFNHENYNLQKLLHGSVSLCGLMHVAYGLWVESLFPADILCI